MSLTEFLLGEKFPEQPITFTPKPGKEYDSFAKKEHDARVLRLGYHLLSSGEFQRVYPFVEYNRGGICGEVDLIAERNDMKAWFEVKFRFKPANLKKAVVQYKNYRYAFPEFKGRAYYVSCDGIIIEISNKRILTQFK